MIRKKIQEIINKKNTEILSIKLIPKDMLIYNLWQAAKVSIFAKLSKDIMDIPSIQTIRQDINIMEQTKDINFTLYYGKILHINITGDTCDFSEYNAENGINLGQYVVSKLKTQLLKKAILNYYIC